MGKLRCIMIEAEGDDAIARATVQFASLMAAAEPDATGRQSVTAGSVYDALSKLRAAGRIETRVDESDGDQKKNYARE